MQSKFITILLALFTLIMQTPSSYGARILAVYVFPSKSHYMMHRALITELLKHGHQVTMITGLSLQPEKLGKNYTEILIEPTFDYWKEGGKIYGKSTAVDLANDLPLLLRAMTTTSFDNVEYALKQPKIQEIINANQTKGVYDLLLVEQLFQEAFLALAHIYDIPVISTSTFIQQNYMSDMFGFITPWSYAPFGYLPLSDHMSYLERVQSVYYSLLVDMSRKFVMFPNMDKLVKRYFAHLAIDFPTTAAMNRNLSAILINSYPPISYPSPKMDNMINVGGMHIYPTKPLPEDIQQFIDEAANGVVYFNLGTEVHCKDLPLEKIQIFLDVFRNLKQRVLWKFENNTLPNLPKNVMVKAWMPQNDILAHPNVRVFIAHGGLFGTQEAIYHGVPIVGIPFFFDQSLNVKRGEVMGYAIRLDIHKLTRDDLNNAINEVLYNPTYREKMKQMSEIFRDRTMGPRETAMYWIDYVIRHKGARHLRSAGLDLKWYQFYLLDVIAFFVAAVAAPLGSGILLIIWIWRKLKNSKSKQKML